MLGFYLFFLLSVVKCFSEDSEDYGEFYNPITPYTGKTPEHYTPIKTFGNVKEVTCDATDRPSATGWGQISTKWRNNFIYPVEVCLLFDGPRKIAPGCPLTNKSRMTLALDNPPIVGRKMKIVQTIPIDVDQFFVNEKHCQIIDASTMAMALREQGRDVTTALEMNFYAFIYGTTTPGEKDTWFRVRVRSAAYYIDSPQKLEAVADPHMKLHAVVCNFPGCKVVATGSVKATKTEKFHIKENEAPLYEPKAGPLTKGMFSVTYFECSSTKCPVKFIAKKQKRCKVQKSSKK